MVFPTDWNVEKYRTEHESDEHWELRRCFLETHKDKFPEERLVCLAQVFCNVEFMGCRYPEETMRLVAQLSKGVADDHREKMKGKLQRTFVQASDAASSKVKGLRGRGSEAASSEAPKKSTIIFCKATETEKPLKSDSVTDRNTPENSQGGGLPNSDSLPGRYVLIDKEAQKRLKKKQKLKQRREMAKRKRDMAKHEREVVEPEVLQQGSDDDNLEMEEPEVKVAKREMEISDQKIGRLGTEIQPPVAMGSEEREIFSKIVLIGNPGTPPYGILSRSFNSAGMTFSIRKEHSPKGMAVSILANGKAIATAVAQSVEEAKTACATQLLQRLKKHCYTLIVKDQLAGSVVDKVKPSDTSANDTEATTFNSKVSQMMAKMGWGGGGLGKEEQGRKEPVQAVENVSRAGLGRDVKGKQFETHIMKMLNNFKNSNASHDLIFAADFTKEERKAIHLIARRRGLKSVSYGKDSDRQLVVSIKRSFLDIAKEVEAAGGSTAKYDVIPPSKA